MTFPCSQHFNTDLFTVQHCFFFLLLLSLTHTDSQVCVRWAQLCSNKTQQQMEHSDSKEVTLDFNFDIYRAFTSTSGDRREQPL